MLDTYFSVQGYDVVTAASGKQAVKACQDSTPDLALLDIQLPDFNGYEIAARLKAEPSTQKIPLIFLTEKRDRVDRLTGLELGVIDYITKPFDMQELRLRVRNVLRQVERRPAPSHPITGLPEGMPVDKQLEKLLKPEGPWALLVLSFTGLKGYRRRYGIVAGDDALRGVSLSLRTSVADKDDDHKDDFVGHLGPEDLVVVTTGKRVKSLKKRLVDEICAAIPYYYPQKEREKRTKGRRARLELKIGQLSQAKDVTYDTTEALRTALLKTRQTA